VRFALAPRGCAAVARMPAQSPLPDGPGPARPPQQLLSNSAALQRSLNPAPPCRWSAANDQSAPGGISAEAPPQARSSPNDPETGRKGPGYLKWMFVSPRCIACSLDSFPLRSLPSALAVVLPAHGVSALGTRPLPLLESVKQESTSSQKSSAPNSQPHQGCVPPPPSDAMWPARQGIKPPDAEMSITTVGTHAPTGAMSSPPFGESSMLECPPRGESWPLPWNRPCGPWPVPLVRHPTNRRIASTGPTPYPTRVSSRATVAVQERGACVRLGRALCRFPRSAGDVATGPRPGPRSMPIQWPTWLMLS